MLVLAIKFDVNEDLLTKTAIKADGEDRSLKNHVLVIY